MKTISLKNEHGETIELRRGIGGGFQIRHSDITGLEWADYYTKAEDMSAPSKAEFFAKSGIDVNSPEFQKVHAMDGRWPHGFQWRRLYSQYCRDCAD